jgi:uncharacterized protein
MNFIRKLIEPFSGGYAAHPNEVELSSEAISLQQQAYEGIPEGPVDNHAHLMGIGSDNTGCYANPEYFSWLHPVERIRMKAFMSATGISNRRVADRQYVQRLLTLTDHSPAAGKICLLAFDKTYREDGSPDLHHTKFHVPNDYVVRVAKERPERFIPAVSVHPYRKDALNELEKWAGKGIKVVKWLPNSQGMDPAHKKCLPFYKKMAELKMVMLGHAGKETAISVARFNGLGNPLLYRNALDSGMKLIMAHCAGLGNNKDLDHPRKKSTKNHKLFLKLMKEKQYEGLLFGDIAAVTIINRMGKPLKDILNHYEIHHRLINGTDYPLPAINALMSLKALIKAGYITSGQEKPLREIYRNNPLVFDFVLKRTVRHPKKHYGFPVSVFKDHPELKITKKLK